MNRVSLKDFITMNERKLVNVTSRVASGFIDITEPAIVFTHYLFFNRFSSNTIKGIKTKESFFHHSLEVIPSILEGQGGVRMAIFDGRDTVFRCKDYTWTSFLFDLVDIARTDPSYVRDYIGDILSRALWLRRNEIEDSCFTAYDGSPMPTIIREKIIEHLNFVQRVCNTGGFSHHDLKKIKVTLLAPHYTWKNWDEFLSPTPIIGKGND